MLSSVKIESYLQGGEEDLLHETVDTENDSVNQKENLLLKKINLARRRTAKIVKDMKHLKTDKEREMYLVQRFIVETMSGFKKSIAQQYFFKNIDSSENCHKFRLRLFCLLALCFMILIVFAFLFYFGVYVGQRASGTWLICIGIALFEDVFVLQPLKIWVKWIVITAPAVKEVNLILAGLRDRVKYILVRKTGLMNTVHSSVQHFNAACRASRFFPSLPTARLLISLNDWDVSEGWDLKKSVADHLFAFLVAFVSIFTHIPFYLQDFCVDFVIAVCFHISIIAVYLLVTTSLQLAGLVLICFIGCFILVELLNFYRRYKLSLRIVPRTEDSSDDDDNDNDDGENGNKQNFIIAKKKKKKKSQFNFKVVPKETFDFDFEDLFPSETKNKMKPTPTVVPIDELNVGIHSNPLFSGVMDSLNSLQASIVPVETYKSIVTRKSKESQRSRRLRITRSDNLSINNQGIDTVDKGFDSTSLYELSDVLQYDFMDFYKLEQDNKFHAENSLSPKVIDELEASGGLDWETLEIVQKSKLFNLGKSRLDKISTIFPSPVKSTRVVRVAPASSAQENIGAQIKDSYEITNTAVSVRNQRGHRKISQRAVAPTVVDDYDAGSSFFVEDYSNVEWCVR